MAKQSLRDIIEIDEELCDGCGLCIPSCDEGALVLVDGKVKLVEDARCDGAGMCIGHCPRGALRLIQRPAEAFDEQYLPDASPPPIAVARGITAGCPGSRAMQWQGETKSPNVPPIQQPSELRQWPIQLHLLSPSSSFLHGRELLLAADCVAFSIGSFHPNLLAGRSLAIACPKLDDCNGYLEKLVEILSHCNVPALRVAIMEVPCCGGLFRLAQTAAQQANYQGQVEIIVISRVGNIIERHQLSSASPPLGSSDDGNKRRIPVLS